MKSQRPDTSVSKLKRRFVAQITRASVSSTLSLAPGNPIDHTSLNQEAGGSVFEVTRATGAEKIL